MRASGREVSLPHPTQRPRAWIAPVLIALAALATLPWSVHAWYDPLNDSSIYVASARSLARGEGYSYLGEPFTARPPGFSALIAPLVGTGEPDFGTLNLFTSLWGVAAVTLFFVWARGRAGELCAAAFAALVWLNPAFQRLCNQTMSDVPGLALLFACLIFEERVRAKPSLAREIALGLAIGIAAYVRMLGVLLAPAILAARLCDRSQPLAARARRGLACLAAAVLALAPWFARNALLDDRGPSDQAILSSYWTAMWHADPGDPTSPRLPLSAVLARVPERAGQIASLFGSAFETQAGGAAAIALGWLVLALALTTAARVREAADSYLAGTLAVLVLYFGFRDRLALPLWMLALPLAARALLGPLERRVPARTARAVLAALVVVLALAHAAPRRDWDEIRRDHEEWQASARSFSDALGPGTRAAAMRGGHYEVYLDRPVYNLAFALARAGELSAADAVFERRAIDAVLVADHDPAGQALKRHLEGRWREQRVAGGSIYWVR